MIINVTRAHKVNMDNYESIELRGSVTVDSLVDEMPSEYEIGDEPKYLFDFLEDLLAPEAQRAVQSHPTAESHIYTFYNLKENSV